MPFSTGIANSILDHYVRKTTWTLPTAFYVGLSSTTPTGTGSNVTEPSGGSYARVSVPAASFNAASSAANATNADIVFARATADWASGANLTYLVIYDAITSGTFLGYKSLTVAKPVLNGDTAKILAGDLTMSIS